jgi:hypothetical protein
VFFDARWIPQSKKQVWQFNTGQKALSRSKPTRSSDAKCGPTSNEISEIRRDRHWTGTLKLPTPSGRRATGLKYSAFRNCLRPITSPTAPNTILAN